MRHQPARIVVIPAIAGYYIRELSGLRHDIVGWAVRIEKDCEDDDKPGWTEPVTWDGYFIGADDFIVNPQGDARLPGEIREPYVRLSDDVATDTPQVTHPTQANADRQEKGPAKTGPG